MNKSQKEVTGKQKISSGAIFRKWSRFIHRDLSFFFSGILIIYALSGIYMNHRDSINPHYTVERVEFNINAYPSGTTLSKEEVIELLKPYKLDKLYTKHYYPKNDYMKVFIKGGSSYELNQLSGKGVVEILSKRHFISDMVKLHYNPGKWWTWFSDVFCVSMIILVDRKSVV